MGWDGRKTERTIRLWAWLSPTVARMPGEEAVGQVVFECDEIGDCRGKVVDPTLGNHEDAGVTG